jgi:acyl-CoA hydrolase/RimJ/RimL family protein N-acetyltransferase
LTAPPATSKNDWRERYASKVCSAEEAVAAIPAGRRVLIGSGAGEPVRLVQAMVESAHHLADNEIVHLLTMGTAPYVQPGMERRFRHTAFFIGANVREAIEHGRADYMPVFLSEIPLLISSRRVRIDVTLIQVSPPDKHGYVSLGVAVDIVRAAVDAADVVLAEVNPRMPRTLGDSFLHVERIARLVPVDYPLPELAPPVLDEASREIGRHVATLVPDGATIQAGIGKIPSAVMAALSNRRDLGIHTEMFSDGMMDLVDSGVANGRRKTLLSGKAVTSFVMGSRKLYEWVDDHPGVELRPSQFTNDPVTVARNDFMIAVNSALAVDLTGQVAADTLAGRFFSGIGGQVDFIRGAAHSRGGKAIIAFTSTAKDGTVSRIQPIFEAGAGVVTSRGDVHYVVTEYGVADLWGKSVRQRAMSLIEIAHPDFRRELLAAAKTRHYVFPDQVAPRGIYPGEEQRTERLRGGETIVVRPVRLTDEQPLQDLFYRLSDDSTHRRFLSFKRRHPHEEMQSLVDLDYEQNMALLAELPEGERERIVAMARYDLDRATNLADIAFVVRDEWQGRGVGTRLMRRMIEIACAHGIAGFTADVLAINKPMIAVFQNSGLKLDLELDHDVYHLTARFGTDRPAPG